MHWKTLLKKKRCAYLESLVHTTKLNKAKYTDFDKAFYKFPSYYRRSAVSAALGQVSSFITRKEEYLIERKTAISNGKKFKKKAPSMNFDTAYCPSMYKNQMYITDNCDIYLKLWIRNTWDWVQVSAAARDMKSLNKAISEGGTLASPKLCISNKKIYLQLPVKFKGISFPNENLSKQTVLGVDLGINNGAVCSVVDSSGTIHERYFDPFKSERDRIEHMLNRLRNISKRSGNGQSLASFYTKLDGLKGNYVRQLASWIVEKARRSKVYGIVMEYLGPMKGYGPKRDRIHHWCKKRIFDLVKNIAFRYGIRVFCVNPKNTSALAFDGSGEVKRNTDNFSLCTFTSGKRYNCDLSASYNIAARYFIRSYNKSISETEWSQCVAKVPALAKRTNCTLSALIDLNRSLCLTKSAA